MLGTVLLAAAFVGVLVAVSYPVAAAVAVAVAAVAGVAGRWGGRALRRRVARRRREGRARTVCVPTTDVCVEA